MRILFIDVNCKFGSTGKIVYDLHSQCCLGGISSAVCYGRGKKIDESGIYKFGIDFETLVHGFLTRITGFTGCFSFFSTKRLIRYIKKFKPDIVHIHELHAYFVNVKKLLVFLKQLSVPVVFTNHCEFIYTGKCGYSQNCTKYQYNCGNCPLLHEYPKSMFFDRTRRMLNIKKSIFKEWNNIYFISPSNWINSKAKLSFLRDKQSTVINNGIDTSVYSVTKSSIREELNIPKNNRIVLTAAPNIFSDVKGGMRFLSIAKKMKDFEYISFVAVGAIGDVPKDKPDNVIVMPLIKEKKKMIDLYSVADVFVICSNRENFPTTSLEAQCCGTKIIGYDIGGVKETILPGNGTVIDYNNEQQAIDAILSTLDSKYDKNTVSQNSKAFFSKERMFKDYLKIYKKLCA